MNEHNIFYYPYASFTNTQLPLLKVAALYFDKLYILDPEKASGGLIGPGEAAGDIALLEREGILERIAPEDVLHKYEQHIADAIRADMRDNIYLEQFSSFEKDKFWRLALAKVPEDIRDDPEYQPLDRPMQRLMGDVPRELMPDLGPYAEVYFEVKGAAPEVYGEYRETKSGVVEYRYSDYPLPLGQSIMTNHALFAGIMCADATPLTDHPFHTRILDLKMKHTQNIPILRQALETRARQRQLKAAIFAATAITDTQLMPALSPQLPLEEILEYRQANRDALEAAREKMGWLARKTKGEPWSEDFWENMEQETIPDLADKLAECEKAQKDWLKKERGRMALKAAGIAAAVASVIVPLVMIPTPLQPVAVATTALGLVSGAAIPGAEWLMDWRDGKKTVQENGLHYLLGPAKNK